MKHAMAIAIAIFALAGLTHGEDREFEAISQCSDYFVRIIADIRFLAAEPSHTKDSVMFYLNNDPAISKRPGLAVTLYNAAMKSESYDSRNATLICGGLFAPIQGD